MESSGRAATPTLLPILRSAQQASLLADVLGDPSREQSIADLAHRLGIPQPSVHREIERAERSGIVESRRVGRTRLIRANVQSPYFEALQTLLTRSFGVPRVLADAFREVAGIESAFVFGSWAAQFETNTGTRAVGDIDVLVLGEPDRDELYTKASEAEKRLGREVQVTIRPAGWLNDGDGSFHATVTSRPMVLLALREDGQS